ncbi:hypothetical protein GJAV_G00031080 [Gymnothorax javanicus]|nr:hypothetical protein GJAV_G00031080 [Gymnothorax javanicus]
MAASASTVTEENSSSEDENLEKFKEAAWSFEPAGTIGARQNIALGGDGNDKPSRRVCVAQHEHDGNELQTTPEFRAHIAKKLVAILDCCITESPYPETTGTSTVRPMREKNEEEDVELEGFRLFSTSVPRLSAKPPSPPAPRRPIPSSSDSDSEMEMRFREAAISAKDLLPPSLLPGTPRSIATVAPPSAEKKLKKKIESVGAANRIVGETENGILKKKKKRKVTKGSAEEGEMEANNGFPLHSKRVAKQDSTEEDCISHINPLQQPDEATLQKKKKRKKKKKTVGDG